MKLVRPKWRESCPVSKSGHIPFLWIALKSNRGSNFTLARHARETGTFLIGWTDPTDEVFSGLVFSIHPFYWVKGTEKVETK